MTPLRLITGHALREISIIFLFIESALCFPDGAGLRTGSASNKLSSPQDPQLTGISGRDADILDLLLLHSEVNEGLLL